MSSRVEPLTLSLIVAELMKERRRGLGALVAQTSVQEAHDAFTVAATPASTYTLSALPLAVICAHLNGEGLVHGSEWSCDNSTGVVTLDASVVARCAAGDVVHVDYLTTAGLTAASAGEIEGASRTATVANPSGSGGSGGLAVSFAKAGATPTLITQQAGAVSGSVTLSAALTAGDVLILVGSTDRLWGVPAGLGATWSKLGSFQNTSGRGCQIFMAVGGSGTGPISISNTGFDGYNITTWRHVDTSNVTVGDGAAAGVTAADFASTGNVDTVTGGLAVGGWGSSTAQTGSPYTDLPSAWTSLAVGAGSNQSLFPAYLVP